MKLIDRDESDFYFERLRRPIGRMTVAEQQFEGEFRYVNSRLITNCEEIAFYNGSRREKMIIRDGFERLVGVRIFLSMKILTFIYF